MFVTGLGSLPGTDFLGAARWVVDSLAPHAFLPQLPARGAGATMVGQAVALLDGLGADLQPSGWRLTSASSHDQRRARALWRRDLDDLEEVAHDYDGELTVALCGPWTLAAQVSRPLGDVVLSDHGARRELGESLAAGLADALAELGRRLPNATIGVQVDEPMLPLVLAGGVPTASGFSKHRRVDVPDAVAGLERVVRPVSSLVTRSVLHCCAPGLDLHVVARSGFTTVALDSGLLTPPQWDAVGQWLEAGSPAGGGDLWLGCLPTHVPDALPSPDEVVRTCLAQLRPLGLDPQLLLDRVALTPACGLAGWTPTASRHAFEVLRRAQPLLAEQLAR